MYALSSRGIILEKVGEAVCDIVPIYVGDIIKASFDNGEITGGVISFTDTTLTLNTSSEPYGTNIVKIEASLLDKIEVIKKAEEPSEEENEGSTEEPKEENAE